MPVVTTSLPDGTEVSFEVDTPEGFAQASSETVLKKIDNAVDTATEKVTAIASSLTSKMRTMMETAKPDSVTLQLGIKFGAEGGVIVAKGSAEANMNISMTWKP